MTIIIADDEKLVRAAIKKMLIELDIDKASISECSNGQEFLESLKRLNPDIAFVDIKMPLLNGLDAISQGRQYSPETSYYILTAFGEFEYAKKAIEMKIADYLLKPIDIQLLKKILADQENKMLSQAAAENNAFNALILDQFYNKTVDSHSKYQDNCFKLFYICIDWPQNCGPTDKTGNSINNFIKSAPGKDIIISAIHISSRQIAVILSMDSQKAGKANEINNFCLKLKAILDEERSFEQKITVIETPVFNGLNNCYEFIKRLKHYAALRILTGISKNYGMHDFKPVSNAVNHQLCDLVDRLVNSYTDRIYAGFAMDLEELSEYMAKYCSSSDNADYVDCVKAYLHFVMGLPDYCLNYPINLFFKAVMEHIDKNILKKYEKEDYVESAKAFLESNYMKDIGITNIADILKINPNYLSTLFHNVTGKKFKKYLTDIRMLKAKKLLIETNLTVDKVSKEVGYFSVSHFIRIFKQYYSMPPSSMKTGQAEAYPLESSNGG